MKIIPIVLFVVFISIFSYQQKCYAQNLKNAKITTGGGLILNINENRLKEDVIPYGFNASAGAEIPIFLKNNQNHIRFSTSLDIAGFAGGDGAFIFASVLESQYIRITKIFGKKIEVGIGGGFEFEIAPTQDAAYNWWGYNFKTDIRTTILGKKIGLYVKFKQILMDNVEDPLFLGIGIEYTFDLFSNHSYSAEKNQIVEKNSPKQQLIVKSHTNLNDTDEDGIKNTKDLCPHTLKGRQIDDKGCRQISDGMKFEYLIFKDKSFNLTLEAQKEILRLGEILKNQNELHIEIVLTATNQELATKRCLTITNELSKYIKTERIHQNCRAGLKNEIYFNFRLKL